MADSGSGLLMQKLTLIINDDDDDDDDKRWSLIDEISKLFNASVKVSFPDFEEHKAPFFASQIGFAAGDYYCASVLKIWPNLRECPELGATYPHIQGPRDIGEAIKRNLPTYADDMIGEELPIRDIGFVPLSLSQKWLAKTIHTMLKDGIKTWAPKLPVERVVVTRPTLDEEIQVGWLRREAIRDTLIRMLTYSKVAVDRYLTEDMDEMHKLQDICSQDNPSSGTMDRLVNLREFCRSQIDEGILTGVFKIDEDRETNVVIDGEGTVPFLLTKRDFHNSLTDLNALRVGIKSGKPDWIVYLAPVRQQEYIEMCFTAAKRENWIITDNEGKWNPSNKNEYPVATYAGYRSCSTETEELANLLGQVKDRCDLVAQGRDAPLLGYSAKEVFNCVLTYTYLKNPRLAECSFNLNEMVEKKGDTFVYLLHSRAKLFEITNVYREEIDELKKASNLILEKYEGWEEGEERSLEFHLLRFTEVLKNSCLFVSLDMMCKYLYDLAKKFNSYNDYMPKAGSVAEASRLLLCEATSVVMDKCFHLLGISPETISVAAEPLLWNLQTSKKQKMAESEQKAIKLLETFVDRFITPSFVSGASETARNSRFVFCSIEVATDRKIENAKIFGLVSVSDKYGLRSAEGGSSHLFEPDFPYVDLFNLDWCDSMKMTSNDMVVYLGNRGKPSCDYSVPFSSSMEICLELYVTNTEDDCCEVCNHKITIDLSDFWGKESNGNCGYRRVRGVDGTTRMHYILLKNAVDTTVEITFNNGSHQNVYGRIFAYYGGNFYYDCFPGKKSLYQEFLFGSIGSEWKDGKLDLEKNVLAVPDDASLIIDAILVDEETGEVILTDRFCEFTRPTNGCISEGKLCGRLEGCSLELKVVWKC